jgi:aldehyde dehydrogenase (NAD+)
MAEIVDDPSAIAAPLERLRNSWRRHKTKSIAFRVAQLQNLQRGVQELMPDILLALEKDLSRTPFISVVFEIGSLTGDLEHTLRDIYDWVRPVKVDTPLMTGPANSYILNEPYGVSLVIGPWNYPISTTL